MAHEVDRNGYPLDPELRRLEKLVGDLAAKWRRTWDDEVVKEYHATIHRLYELGWDSVLDVESELPDDLMPQEYIERPRPTSHP